MAQTILITGASSGIGLAITTFLLSPLSPPHTILACTHSNPTPLRTLQSQSQSQNTSRLHIIQGDMADPSFTQTLLPQSLLHFGVERVDALVLNHGTLGECKRIAEMKGRKGEGQGEWERVMRVNVGSYVDVIQHLIPYLRESQGKIIMTSSGAAENAYTGWGAYGASKAAINHLARTLAKEEPSITTLAIRPGMVDTQMQTDIRGKYLQNMDEDDQAKFASAHKDGKLLPPEKPGNVMARLAMDLGLGSKGLSGAFLSWNDEKLKDYQDQ